MLAEKIDRGQSFKRGDIHLRKPSPTSGSAPWSVLAQLQIPIPSVQSLMADSISSHCRAGCFPRDNHIDVVPATQAMIGD